MSVTDFILKGSSSSTPTSSFSNAFEQSQHVWNSVKASQIEDTIQEDITTELSINNTSEQIDDQDDKRTIFIGNLPTKLGIKGLKKALKGLFSKYGAIESMRFRGIGIADPKVSKKVNFIKQNFHERRDTMIAYIKFKSEDSVEPALKENNTVLKATGSEIDGNAKVLSKHIRVDRTNSSTSNKNTENSVFLGNLPYGVTEEEIRNHFSSCGNIECVRIVRDADTGMGKTVSVLLSYASKGKGFGFITFGESGSTFLALEMNETQFAGNNRTIRVALCENKPKTENKRRKFDNTPAIPNKKQKTRINKDTKTQTNKKTTAPVWSGKQAKEGDLNSKAIKRKVKKKKKNKDTI